MPLSINQTQTTAYIGRFAPSPTGGLHFGSLVAALASYLDAKAHKGQWLVRIEDLDPPREVEGAADSIIQILSEHGMCSDIPIIYQSKRGEIYQQYLDRLIATGQVFRCQCSRKQLSGQRHWGGASPQCIPNSTNFAWRFHCPDIDIAWHDRLQGDINIRTHEQLDDVVLKRRDNLWAYQLAMTIDDHLQGVTHVVRGIDLLMSTPYQRLLQSTFHFNRPVMMHIPIATESNGQKLSKQNRAIPISSSSAENNLLSALTWLKQPLPKFSNSLSVNEIIQHAVTRWDPRPLIGIKAIQAL